MNAHTHARSAALVVALVLGLCVLAAPVQAQQVVTGCPFTCTSDCELQSDVVCFGQSAIILSGGADLDLNGHTIDCFEFPGVPCHSAVAIVNANSEIADSGSPKGAITGRFDIAIDCLGKKNSRVVGVRISDADTGLLNCAQMVGNVITTIHDPILSISAGIYTGTVPNSTNYIKGNYLQGYIRGMLVSGPKPVTVAGNTIVLGRTAQTANIVGISVAGSSSSGTVVEHNSVIGTDPINPIVGNLTATFTDNRCDTTNSKCANCIADGYCVEPRVPLARVPVVRLQPTGPGDENSFATEFPSGLNLPDSERWLLVDDYPDVYELHGVTLPSYVCHAASMNEATELYQVKGVNNQLPFGLPDPTLQSCTLSANMIAAGGLAVHADVRLIVKSQGVESIGPLFQVTGGADILPVPAYSRVMTTNPFTNLPWTIEDLREETLQIGVRQEQSSIFGTYMSAIILECR